jgi:DNA-binding sugar fermentation-stimulating protein
MVKVYEGETGRSARTRGAEHLKELEKKKEKSVLFKHKMSDHKHETVKFQMQITKKFEDALTRQADEAVRIYSRPASESLNSKSEFNHPPHARVVVERKK